jgi:hypothetical protein
MTTSVKFQLRRDTATNWSTNNTILLLGEPGFDSTNNQLRIGNGVTGWNSINQLDVKTNGAVAIGTDAGQYGQASDSISIGNSAGQYSQKLGSISIGFSAGQTGQGLRAVSVGYQAGQYGQGIASIAIGASAGQTGQQNSAIAIGQSCGVFNQQVNAIAIGTDAGYTGQGINSIAIGANAGVVSQPNYTIILNGLGTALNGVAGQTARFYVAPVRNYANENTFSPVGYNPTTNEVGYAAPRCGIHTCIAGTTQIITITGLTTSGVVGLTYNHPGGGGAGQFFVSSTPTPNTLTVELGQSATTAESIIWIVGKL